jgi:hypothetical protein
MNSNLQDSSFNLFQMVKDALEAEGIDVDEAAEPLSLHKKNSNNGHLRFSRKLLTLLKKAPEENTITPYWNRNY